MPKEPLIVKMLGGFSLQYGGRELVVDRGSISKTTQLLQMMMLHTEDGISKASLIDGLYGREDVENRNGSLNNTLFRLRKQLGAAGLPESNYIEIQKGMCRWDSRIPVEVDCCMFERQVRESQELEDEDARMAGLTKACGLYTGEFLPSMIGEDWATVRNIHYRNLYFACLEELCAWLKDREEWEEIYRLATAASQVYPFEEWQIWRIDSLIAMARYKEAMEIYQKTTKLFFDELSLPPSPQMLERFRFMSERISQSAGAIEDIKRGLTEREQMRGAYFCTFPSFVDIYHVISRMMERSGASVYIMLCTLKGRNGPVLGNDERSRETSGVLMEAIRESLRRGDFYTRYNTGQYLVMLSGINQENCGKVSARIERSFKRQMGRSEFQVDYYVASVAEISPHIPEQPRSFQDAASIWKEQG